MGVIVIHYKDYAPKTNFKTYQYEALNSTKKSTVSEDRGQKYKRKYKKIKDVVK